MVWSASASPPAAASSFIVNLDDLAATAVRDVDIDLGGGDNTIDTVVTRGTRLADDITLAPAGKSGVVFAGLPVTVRVLNSEERFDNLSLLTLDGDDAIAGGVGIVGPERVTVEGGEGTDTMTYRGTGAADAVALGEGVAGRVRATARRPVPQEAAVSASSCRVRTARTCSRPGGAWPG